MTGTGARNLYLRVGLGVALVALVAVAVVLAVSQGSHADSAGGLATTTSATTVATTQGTATPDSRPPDTTPTSATSTTTIATPSTTVPGAVTGPITEPEQSGGCALALVSSAPPGSPGHCTAIMIGDSLGMDVGSGIAHNLPVSTGVTLYQLSRSDSGLAVPAFFNWPSELQTFLGQYKPQLVVICLGGNDQQGMVVNGHAVQFGTPAWDTEYVNRIHQLVGEATATGAYVMWVGLPIMQQPTYDAGSQTLNMLYQQALSTQINSTYVSIRSVLANPQGAYESPAAVNGAETTLRSADGVHLNIGGEEVVGTYVVQEMARVYHVALTPSAPAAITSWG